MRTVGWHYTAASNLPSIRENGMVPYQINKPELGDCPPAIWTWIEEPTGANELGILIYQLSEKQDTSVVKLRLAYDDTDCFLPSWIDDIRGDAAFIIHTGSIGKWFYHRDFRSRLVKIPIPPADVTVERVFDLVELIQPDRPRRSGWQPLNYARARL